MAPRPRAGRVTAEASGDPVAGRLDRHRPSAWAQATPRVPLRLILDAAEVEAPRPVALGRVQR